MGAEAPGQVQRAGRRVPPLQGPAPRPLRSEKGEVLLRGVGALRYLLILGENSARVVAA